MANLSWRQCTVYNIVIDHLATFVEPVSVVRDLNVFLGRVDDLAATQLVDVIIVIIIIIYLLKYIITST